MVVIKTYIKKNGNYSAPRLGDAMIFGENRENKISVLPLDFCKSG